MSGSESIEFDNRQRIPADILRRIVDSENDGEVRGN
jgi:hypothetical protein